MPENIYPAIEVQLTTRCNLRCAHCYVETGARDMPLERVEEIAAFAQGRGCTHLSFTGGEPTLHPQFARVLRVTVDHGLKFALVSNGWGFAGVFPTSAFTGEGCDALLKAIREHVHWEDLPAVSSTETLAALRDFVRKLKGEKASETEDR